MFFFIGGRTALKQSRDEEAYIVVVCMWTAPWDGYGYGYGAKTEYDDRRRREGGERGMSAEARGKSPRTSHGCAEPEGAHDA